MGPPLAETVSDGGARAAATVGSGGTAGGGRSGEGGAVIRQVPSRQKLAAAGGVGGATSPLQTAKGSAHADAFKMVAVSPRATLRR